MSRTPDNAVISDFENLTPQPRSSYRGTSEAWSVTPSAALPPAVSFSVAVASPANGIIVGIIESRILAVAAVPADTWDHSAPCEISAAAANAYFAPAAASVSAGTDKPLIGRPSFTSPAPIATSIRRLMDSG